MSVRTEPKDLSQQLQQTLTIPADVMQQATNPQMVGVPAAQEGSVAQSDHALGAANDFNTSSPEHPLERTVVINIRSSLSDLCLRGAKATWQPPSTEATKAIFQQAPRHLPSVMLLPWPHAPTPPRSAAQLKRKLKRAVSKRNEFHNVPWLHKFAHRPSETHKFSLKPAHCVPTAPRVRSVRRRSSPTSRAPRRTRVT